MSNTQITVLYHTVETNLYAAQDAIDSLEPTPALQYLKAAKQAANKLQSKNPSLDLTDLESQLSAVRAACRANGWL